MLRPRRKFSLDTEEKDMLTNLVLPKFRNDKRAKASKYDFLRETVRDYIRKRISDEKKITAVDIQTACFKMLGKEGVIPINSLRSRLKAWNLDVFLGDTNV